MKRAALFVGIDQYKDPSITPLACACNDALELYGEFRARQFDSVKMIPNDKADDHTILTAVKEMVQDLGKDDLFVFYFAGHGREINNVHYLMGTTAWSQEELFSQGALSVPALRKFTDKQGLHRLFILDCCRSELLTGRAGSFAVPGSRDPSLQAVVKPDASDLAIIPPLILSSCSSGERAFELKEENHGAFTAAFLRVLGKKDSPVCTLMGMLEKINDTISSLIPKGMSQTVSTEGNLFYWDKVPLFEDWTWKKEMQKAPGSGEPVPESVSISVSAVKSPSVPAEEIPPAEQNDCGMEGLVFSPDRKTLLKCTDKTIREVQIPSFVEIIDTQAFSCCFSLQEVIIPSSVRVIGNYAFSQCVQLEKIRLPEGVTLIGDQAFASCKNLRSVQISSSVRKIGDHAFSSCILLEDLQIEPGLNEIGKGAFMQCRSLKELQIPSTVTVIGESAFFGVPCRGALKKKYGDLFA